MKLRLNLSTTPQENNRPFLAGAILLGTVGLLALLILSRAAYSSWQSNRQLRAEISHWQEEIRTNHVKQQDLAQYFQTPAAREVIDRSVFLNSLIDERSFPWTKIFMDLEKTLPPGVRIVSISPHLVNGRAVPTFPRARYIVQKSELEHALHPTERDKASYFPDNFQPVVDSHQWDLTDGPARLSPGISVELIPGHNAGIQAVKLSGGGKTLVFVADLLPTRHHIPLAWIMAYDLYPLQTLETKRKWVAQIVQEDWIVVFGHDPDIPAAKLHEREGKIEIEPVNLNG